mmetsp:Transcript_39180/g.113205  ORF Transcript_39180/g.113205 Transcript_39180/m.113205 type:complete len:242 (-) Transcript_39180:86-811(-)
MLQPSQQEPLAGHGRPSLQPRRRAGVHLLPEADAHTAEPLQLVLLVCDGPRRRRGRAHPGPLRRPYKHLRLRQLDCLERWASASPHPGVHWRVALGEGLVEFVDQRRHLHPRLGCHHRRGQVGAPWLHREGRPRHGVVPAKVARAPEHVEGKLRTARLCEEHGRFLLWPDRGRVDVEHDLAPSQSEGGMQLRYLGQARRRLLGGVLGRPRRLAKGRRQPPEQLHEEPQWVQQSLDCRLSPI